VDLDIPDTGGARRVTIAIDTVDAVKITDPVEMAGSRLWVFRLIWLTDNPQRSPLATSGPAWTGWRI